MFGESSSDVNKGALGGAHGGDGAAVVCTRPNSIEEDGVRNCNGSRWPRQETLALINIRSEMDAAFRGSCPKAPLWEEVSRKLAEFGYHRNAKKCKEKFENIYKYHRRTKQGRTSKQENKTYKFFEQLEALELKHSSVPPAPLTPPKARPPSASQSISFAATPANLPWIHNRTINACHNATISQKGNPIVPLTQQTKSSFANMSENLFISSPSSSTASDEEIKHKCSKKRKWKEFFRKLTQDVIAKQQELQEKFLETIDKREQQRVAREESWRIQETARINREHEVHIQEHATTAVKNSAIITSLQYVSAGTQINIVQTNGGSQVSQPPALPLWIPTQCYPSPTVARWDVLREENRESRVVMASSSRWPKVEVEALIELKTSLDGKYQENVPKGSIWEEVSAGMRKLGYNRNAKKCKEKWENINKYYKRLKDSNKIRSEDSKTCPYFHQLNALYREKKDRDVKNGSFSNNGSYGQDPTERSMEPLMVRPERQWPPQEQVQKVNSSVEDDNDSNEKSEDEEITEENDQNGYEVGADKGVQVGAGELIKDAVQKLI